LGQEHAKCDYHPLTSLINITLEQTRQIAATVPKANDNQMKGFSINALSSYSKAGKSKLTTEVDESPGEEYINALYGGYQAQGYPGQRDQRNDGRNRRQQSRGRGGGRGRRAGQQYGGQVAAQYAGPPRQRNNQGRFVSSSRRNQNRNPQRQGRTVFAINVDQKGQHVNALAGGYTPKPRTSSTMKCFNCNFAGHRWATCRMYNGAEPGSTACSSCAGRHKGPCKRSNVRVSAITNSRPA
jgi:hypothetical protein